MTQQTPHELSTGSVRNDSAFTPNDIKEASAIIDDARREKERFLKLTGIEVVLDPSMPPDGFRIFCGSKLYERIQKGIPNTKACRLPPA